MYFIGIDGGGTKTAIYSVNTEDYKLHRIETSGSSWRETGIPSLAQMLKNAVNDLTAGGKIGGIAMGLPCYGESIEGDRLLNQMIKDIFPGICVYLTNDVEVGWAGSLALRPGINVIAGTGSITFGKDSSGKTERSGGWSEFFGDEGSCYWIGRKLMEIFSKQSDGRLPKDELYTIVKQEFKLENDFDFIDIVHSDYINNRKEAASLQLIAKKAAMAGSVSAKALYDEAADELLLMVNAVRGKLDFNDEPWAVSYSGGLFKSGEFVLPRFSGEIEKAGGVVLKPQFKPVQGALLLALQHFNPDELNKIIKIMEKNNESDLH